MSFALLAVLLAAPATLPACSWDRPGVNPFMGDVVAAVDRYSDIPADVRKTLKERMTKRAYDEMATIERDAIVGKATYEPDIRDMHFGAGQVCRTVTRKNWTDKMRERGLVYCESGHCLIVPTVCRNVSRITRKAAALADNETVEPKDTLAASAAIAADEAKTGGGSAGSAGLDTPDLPTAAHAAAGSFGGPGASGFVGALIDAVRGVSGFVAALPSALFASAPVSRLTALFGGDTVVNAVPAVAPAGVPPGQPSTEAAAMPAQSAAASPAKPEPLAAPAGDKPAGPAGPVNGATELAAGNSPLPASAAGAQASPSDPVKVLIGDGPVVSPATAPALEQPGLIVGAGSGSNQSGEDDGVGPAPWLGGEGAPEIFIAGPGLGSAADVPATFVKGEGVIGGDGPPGIPAAETVPEPASWALLLAGALMLSLRGGRGRG